MKQFFFRQAKIEDLEAIWPLFLYAKETMRQRGTQQWQGGYPFKETIEQDIVRHYAYVVEEAGEVIAYVAISRDGEPTYQKIEGAWLNQDPYIVGHRMVVGKKGRGRGLGSFMIREAEKIAIIHGIRSVRVDTNFDNQVMKHIFEKEGYTYCGIIQVRDGKREAFQKILV